MIAPFLTVVDSTPSKCWDCCHRSYAVFLAQGANGAQFFGAESHALLSSIIYAQIGSYDVLALGQGLKRNDRKSRRCA